VFTGGKVNGGGSVTGATTNQGIAVSKFLSELVTSNGNGTFEFKSGGSGFVDTE
jgi:hypothetical protein